MSEEPGLIEERLAELDTDAPLGESSVPRSRGPISEEASEVHSINFADEMVYEQLTVSKYRSIRAVFREYLTNAIGACLDARDHLDESYSPTIHIAYHPHENLVVIEDNGIGVSREKLDEMLNPGHSANRDRPDRPGKYGIGRLAGAVATGSDGGYVMDTTSRVTGETITGVWTGLDFAEYDDMDSSLGEDQYGTRFELPLAEDTEVQDHLENLAPYSRIPVLYTEHDPDGSKAHSEEYGGTRYTMDTDPTKSVVFENDYLRAVAGKNGLCGINDLKEKVVVLDAPIKSEASVSIPFPFNYWGLLLKEESARIVSGPNEGLVRVSNSEYDGMDDERREQYIPVRDCSPDDIHIPTPVGDRDRLHENPEFFEWLRARLIEAIVQKIRQGAEHYLSNAGTELQPHDADEFAYLGHQISRTLSMRDHKRDNYRDNLSVLVSHLGKKYPDSRVEDLKTLLYRTIEYCPPDGGDPAVAQSREDCGLWRAFYERGPDGDVFMAVSPNIRKARVIWQDSREHALIRIRSADRYEKYEQYGFRKLKTITDDLDEFDCSQSAKAAFQKPDSTDQTYENPNAGKKASERQLSVHWHERLIAQDTYEMSKWSHSTKSVLTGDLYEALENGESSLTTIGDEGEPLSTPDEIVLFPPSTDRNLSDYRRLVGIRGTWVANCAKMTADYLCELPHVRTIDDVLTEAATSTVTTPEGTFTLRELRDHDPYDIYLFHLVDESIIDAFRTIELPLIDTAKEAVVEKGPRIHSDIRDFYSDDPNHPEIAYIPVLIEEIEMLHTLFPTFDLDRIALITDGSKIRFPDVLRGGTSRSNRIYASYRLQEWEGSDIYNQMTGNNCPSLSNGGYEIIEILASYANQGYPPDLDELPFSPFDPETAAESGGSQ